MRKGRETEGREEWEGHVDRVTVGGGRQRYERGRGGIDERDEQS